MLNGNRRTTVTNNANGNDDDNNDHQTIREPCLLRLLNKLGGASCLTLLVEYGLICCLRHDLSNTDNCIMLHYSPLVKNMCVRQVVLDK